jgi:hypothetical protein
LRILAVIILLAALCFWAAKGANFGWNIDNIRHDTMDPVTGLSRVTWERAFFWERAFIPGWDFLAEAALAAVIMGCASFLFRNKKAQN